MDNLEELYSKIKEDYFTYTHPVKKKIQRLNALDYFFKERKKIIIWNRKYGLLKFSMFHTKIKLINEFKQKMDDLFVKNVLALTKYLDRIIFDGWQWGILSILEYNAIVYFTDFCNKMSKFDQMKHFSIKEYLIVEEAFLKITNNHKYPQVIKTGLEKILIFYKKIDLKNTDEIKEQLRKLEFFFLSNFYVPSFYDLITGYNISITKRYIQWNELTYHSQKEAISSKFYDCSKDTFTEIIRQIDTLSNEIESLKKERDHIEWLKNTSDIKNIDRPETIAKFYESLGNVWDKDKDDLLLLFLLLTGGILKKLKELIESEFHLMTDREKITKIKIISYINVITIFKKINEEYELAKNKHDTMVPLKILLKEFLRAEYPAILFKNPDQKYLYEKIEKILFYYRELSMIFSKYIAEKEKFNENFLRYMIVNPIDWRGIAVFSVFNFFISLFLQMCGYFKEKELILNVKKLGDIKSRLKSKEERLASIKGNDRNILNLLQNFSIKRD